VAFTLETVPPKLVASAILSAKPPSPPDESSPVIRLDELIVTSRFDQLFAVKLDRPDHFPHHVPDDERDREANTYQGQGPFGSGSERRSWG
jgi:hypothetical protein